MNIFKAYADAVSDTTGDIERNKPLLLTVLGLVGFGATIFEVAYAKPKADALIKKRHEERVKEESKMEEIGKDVLTAAPVYLPAVATGICTVGCFVGSYSESSKRTAAYSTAYMLTETKLKEYQKKVVETIGEKKEQKIRNEIVADKVKNNPPSNDIILNDADTLCYDACSGRYFKINIEDLRRTIAALNERLYSEMFISLNEFYYELGLPEIRLGENAGFNVEDGPIAIPDNNWTDYKGRPCLVLDYDYAPRFDWRTLH